MAWKVVKSQHTDPAGVTEYIGDTTDTYSTLPDDAAVGSVAYTADMSVIYMKAPNGDWETLS